MAKNKFNINIIDVFVCLLIIGAVLGTVYKLRGPMPEVVSGDQKIHYTVKLENRHSFMAQYYEQGMTVYNSNTGMYMGEIESVQVSPYKRQIIKPDGSAVMAELPDRSEILVGIVANGVETENSYLIGGNLELKIDMTAYVTTKYLEESGNVMEVWSE